MKITITTKRKPVRFFSVIVLFVLSLSVSGQANNSNTTVPKVLQNIQTDESGNSFILTSDSTILSDIVDPTKNILTTYELKALGTNDGIFFDFKDENLNGTLFFGLIHYANSKYPLPVYRSSAAKIMQGKVLVNFMALRGNYDMTGWEDSGSGTIGYRIIDTNGYYLFDGKVSFSGTGPFEVVNAIVSGPFINIIQAQGTIISFVTSEKSVCEINVNGNVFKDHEAVFNHEVEISGLSPETEYPYTIKYGELEQSYSFRTAPLPGSRKEFVFAYTSDSRAGAGGGERNFNGTNAYMIKKIMAISAQNEVAFAQFTGDLISGYSSSEGKTLLQYRNFKNAIEPFGHYFQITMGMGNHEAYIKTFRDKERKYRISVDNFPYNTNSAEVLFASVAVNPHNGPKSEDNSKYDPDKSNTDFPSYDENVFYYTYDNVAMVNLNSNYWYTPSAGDVPAVGGNIHGYVMDNQLEWFKNTLKTLEKDPNIDHVFVTIHTPFFPNSAHILDDMWYGGKNEPRPWIAGIKVDKGIIERRDQLLDLMINKSTKVVAMLTGDEHNYCKTKIGPETIIYPENYPAKKIKLKRTVYQINNGAAGAPYYAQREVPWTPFTTGFSTQNAVCFFTIEGDKINMVVINPDSLEEIDRLEF